MGFASLLWFVALVRATKGERDGANERERKIAALCRLGKPPKDAPPHANYITYLGPNAGTFRSVFGQFGATRA